MTIYVGTGGAISNSEFAQLYGVADMLRADLVRVVSRKVVRIAMDEMKRTTQRTYGPPVKGRGGKVKRW